MDAENTPALGGEKRQDKLTGREPGLSSEWTLYEKLNGLLVPALLTLEEDEEEAMLSWEEMRRIQRIELAQVFRVPIQFFEPIPTPHYWTHSEWWR